MNTFSVSGERHVPKINHLHSLVWSCYVADYFFGNGRRSFEWLGSEIIDLAPWLVGAAFLVLVGEWWLFNRVRGVR